MGNVDYRIIAGEESGKGTKIYADGRIYKGELEDEKERGHGVCTFLNGDRYDGQWQNGLRHGKCTFTFCNRQKFYTGDFNNGEMTGENVKCEYADGNVYRGGWKDGRRHGFGTVDFPNGDKCEGQWSGSLNGEGKFHYANGDSFEGKYSNYKIVGKGVLTKENGDAFEIEYPEGTSSAPLPTIGQLEEKLREQIHTKAMDDLDKESGIGKHADTPESKEVRNSWVSKVSGKRPDSPTRGI